MMLKKYISFLLYVVSFTLVSQTNNKILLKPRFLFEKQKVNTNNLVVLDSDTLYNTNNRQYNFSYLNDFLDDEKFLKDYKTMVFVYSYENSKTVYHISQWNTPIIVYIDPKIPKTIIKDFKKFYEQLDGIDNLSVQFTKDINKANYLIETTSKNIHVYGENYTFSSEDERENSIFSGVKYQLSRDDNSKFYSATLTINIEHNSNNNLKQLKQLFFMSLGNFYSHHIYDQSSLLCDSYWNSTFISDTDLAILKLHYHIIYPQKVNSNTFNKLMKQSR